VAHNIAKVEEHTVRVDGAGMRLVPADDTTAPTPLMVHRKGATRAFPAGHPAVPEPYRAVGQPVLLPGSMGTASYVLVGGPASMHLSFGSTAHGAGRRMSRTAARERFDGAALRSRLQAEQGVHIAATTDATVAEEAPAVYKDVDAVVAASDAVGIATAVARMRPVCNVKG
jgi:tRNA-splicing ligase RtcB